MRRIDPGNFQRATRATTREINRRIVLTLVHEHQPISRADLARRMGITRGMVTALVGDLLDEGLIYEGELGAATRGRRPTHLFVRTADRLAAAVDVRQSRTWVALGDFEGRTLGVESFPTVTAPDVLADEIAARVARLVATHRRTGTCEGLGIVVPGMVDRRTERVVRAPQLGWADVDFVSLLRERVSVPCTIENAPIACALARMWLAHRDAGAPAARADDANFVYVTVSDGVGTGIVIGGEVLRGAVGTAGEFGHVPLAPNGPRCSCGSLGCWEAFVSNLATRSRFAELMALSPHTAHDRPRGASAVPEVVPVDEIVTWAMTGDPAALTAVRETGNYLGLGLAMIVNALNPGAIVV
ncbi:MAG: ROK family protein, partial [Gemmatimonadaceae bacterium]|nr:ROK family protein [Gemmatimonadaceae bacterium]MCU0627288.1 ROK family protein [Gemmatimonadaceae bacterium]